MAILLGQVYINQLPTFHATIPEDILNNINS